MKCGMSTQREVVDLWSEAGGSLVLLFRKRSVERDNGQFCGFGHAIRDKFKVPVI
jgi:hypothetical protein